MRLRPNFFALPGLLLVVGAAGAAMASDHVVRVRPGAAPRPSGRRYACLNDVARQLGLELAADELTGVRRLRRGGRQVAVVPGVAAVLVGSELVGLDDEVVVHYGRVYVPRAILSRIEGLFRGVARRSEPAGPPKKGTPAVVPKRVHPPRYVRRVCIDPGHGGKDPGAYRRGRYREKDLVLPVSRMLAAELRRRGLEVVMTRERDVFVELNERPAIAARKGADLFVSIHMNSIAKSWIRGVEIFYCDGKYDPMGLAAEASRAGRRAAPEDVAGASLLPAGVNQTVLEMLFEEYHRESAELAEALDAAFSRAGCRVRSTRSAGYRVLRLAEMPAVLIELGFLTNRSEERLLKSSWYQRRLAQAIADGIESFRRRLAQTRGFSM